MEKLDYEYLASLVQGVQHGSSDAFAELFAATYQKTYRFAFHYLEDEVAAGVALKETYSQALRRIHDVGDPMLFVSWLSQLAFRVCFGMKQAAGQGEEKEPASSYSRGDVLIEIDRKQFLSSRVLGLPSTEGQVLVLYYYHKMSVRSIAKLLEIRAMSVRQHLKSGRNRLNLLAAW